MKKSRDKYKLKDSGKDAKGFLPPIVKRPNEPTYDNLITMNESKMQLAGDSSSNLFKEDTYQLSLKPLTLKERLNQGTKITKIDGHQLNFTDDYGGK